MVFKKYTNRFGKRIILDADLLACFEAMKAGLDTANIDVDVCDGWRGQADQEKYKSQGTSDAHFGDSAHNYGVAMDIVPIIGNKFRWDVPREMWLKIGHVGEQLGLQWGLDWNRNGIPDDVDKDANKKWIRDAPHFNIAGWKDMHLTLYSDPPPVDP